MIENYSDSVSTLVNVGSCYCDGFIEMVLGAIRSHSQNSSKTRDFVELLAKLVAEEDGKVMRVIVRVSCARSPS